MHHEQLQFADGWNAIVHNTHALGATMMLSPGASEGGPDNLHPANLLLVERGETHEIRNTGATPLHTLSVYVPPLPAS